jgi:hypothetical protein
LWIERTEAAKGKPLGTIKGISRRDIMEKYHAIFHRPLSESTLRSDILPMLERAGLLIQEQDPDDKRKLMVILVGE